jgi:hypothetical protein
MFVLSRSVAAVDLYMNLPVGSVCFFTFVFVEILPIKASNSHLTPRQPTDGRTVVVQRVIGDPYQAIAVISAPIGEPNFCSAMLRETTAASCAFLINTSFFINPNWGHEK